MKITTFDPIIVTADANPVVEVFEDLGFVRTHAPVGTSEQGEAHGVRMEDANGFHVDIAKPARTVTGDEVIIRVNVDDFEEACAMLGAHGFSKFIDTRDQGADGARSFESATYTAPSGMRIALVRHIR